MNEASRPPAGQVALVTGAARRIGACIARRLHAEGMRVAVHYRHSEGEAEALCAELDAARPGSARCFQADLLQTSAIGHLVDDVTGAFGRLDVVVNNASSFFPTPVGRIDETAFEDLVGTNLKAPLFVAQAAAAHLEATGGCIVNIADLYGLEPLGGHAVYCAAKAGLVMLTRCLARELGPAVRVNAVAPGAILWPEVDGHEAERRKVIARTALKRRGEPEDVAAAVVFLVRDAPYVSGEVLRVDGGR